MKLTFYITSNMSRYINLEVNKQLLCCASECFNLIFLGLHKTFHRFNTVHYFSLYWKRFVRHSTGKKWKKKIKDSLTINEIYLVYTLFFWCMVRHSGCWWIVNINALYPLTTDSLLPVLEHSALIFYGPIKQKIIIWN